MVEIQQVSINGQAFYKMTNSDAMRPFFMSIVSDVNHWMFISSNGGLSAGRKNAEYALFPYYTDDKITESAEITGSKSIFRVEKEGNTHLWEPYSIRYRDRYQISRNLYKSIYGNEIIFEEINHDLELAFRYQWSSSNRFGFVRTATLKNLADSKISVSALDGVQNIVPYGVGSELQNRSSNLVDAYKRNELDRASGIGIFALSAIIVDKAEPSEALKANIVWSLGLENPTYLVSSRQLEAFRNGETLREETDVKGEKGAYFAHQQLELAAVGQQSWTMVANVNQNHAAVARLQQALEHPQRLEVEVREDVALGTKRLVGLCAAADGIQQTADSKRDTRHFSNVLFNIMRGGIFDDNYNIERQDFLPYLKKANQAAFAAHRELLDSLPAIFTLEELKSLLEQSTDPDFQRLCLEYLPLKFSRRHGDPSRPWNRFSINTNSEIDGSKILDYEGNWRDIFQNWEALAYAYPEFIEGMISKFVNATTFDGYNPYRVTKDGFDWETIEPDDPWSYIGYWGDHQIIYLLKFLELIEKHQPGQLERYFSRDLFVYANVPYKIKSYEDILANPKDTIDFDQQLDAAIRKRRKEMGADGALLTDRSGDIYRVNFMEKLLATLLAKLSNYIPEGGIWMNTQRPEWNDANNALVGNGVSMVTLYYLRRFLNFFDGLLDQAADGPYAVSRELKELFEQITATLSSNENLLQGSINDKDRKAVLDGLGKAGDRFRTTIYQESFSGEKEKLSREELRAFTRTALAHIDHSVRANRREDGLYHAYNLMTPEPQGVSISYLSEMLEGQVAVLSAGSLTPTEALSVLDGMKQSALFRPDQYSYILYPNKQLPGFLSKNVVPATAVDNSQLLSKMVAAGDGRIVERDVHGAYHFNGNFKNAADLGAALDTLEDPTYAKLAEAERKQLLGAFEAVFNHKEFTGRSGTFFGYEGLGSIYWHMVSKLLLAVQECCLDAIEQNASAETTGRLLEHYYEILEGIGVHKSPTLYGAFPTDPYSHTPAGKGAQQPGMTGQVKEDILSRIGELGVIVHRGQLTFRPDLLRKAEFQTSATEFEYVDLAGKRQSIDVPAKSLCFTYCQVPVIYSISGEEGLDIHFTDGRKESLQGASLTQDYSRHIFQRTDAIHHLRVKLAESSLK
ncbi:hypothetical protein [Lewinella sp. W8]|uniref:hypothetical protein n=1 Tax=Lewinella sp. W8 TaxID=2528208 RepID=UPI0010683630|nr:hypothetical protein [Lewinella sp. W8]MTB50011.1 hypothetical protein [Lewinella sp. W8]